MTTPTNPATRNPFPTPHTVGHRAQQTGGKDSHGNPTTTWDDPVPHAVYGWAPPSTGTSAEPFEAGRNAVITHLKVYAPATLKPAPQDRIDVDGTTYEVIGLAEDYTTGPFDWAPGVVIDLTRVEG